MWISPRSFGKARVVSHVDAGATLAAAMDLLRVAAFVGAFIGAAVGAARGSFVLAVPECNFAPLDAGTARPPDVLNGAARVDLQRLAEFEVDKALVVRLNALECIVAHVMRFALAL